MDRMLVSVGCNTTLAESVKILSKVSIGENCIIQDNVFLGYKSCTDLEEKVIIIGDNSIIRSGSVIYAGVTTGANFDCGHNVLIRDDCKIGESVYVYPSTQLHRNIRIGDNCRIAGWICNNSIIMNDVCSFGQLVHKYDIKGSGHVEQSPIIMNGAMVGWNSIIIGGITIGENAIIGAGAIVRKDVLGNEKVISDIT